MSGIPEGSVCVLGKLRGRLVGFRNPGKPGTPIRMYGPFKLLDAVVERDGVQTRISGTILASGKKPVFMPGVDLVNVEGMIQSAPIVPILDESLLRSISLIDTTDGLIEHSLRRDNIPTFRDEIKPWPDPVRMASVVKNLYPRRDDIFTYFYEIPERQPRGFRPDPFDRVLLTDFTALNLLEKFARFIAEPEKKQ